jgi:hypothetical protein
VEQEIRGRETQRKLVLAKSLRDYKIKQIDDKRQVLNDQAALVHAEYARHLHLHQSTCQHRDGGGMFFGTCVYCGLCFE